MSVAIELDKPRTLKFDLAALRDLETVMDGKPMFGIIGDMQRLSITAITAALWAGLKHEDKALNINLVTKILGTYIKGGNGAEKSRALVRAIDEAISETGLFASEDDEGNAQPEPATP